MPRPTRRTVFVVLTIITIATLAASLAVNRTINDGILANIFWLFVEVFLTVVVLESVLESAAVARRRDEDSFAFRTFTARGLSVLQQIAGVAQSRDASSLFSAALQGNDKFAEVARTCVKHISEKDEVQPASYNSNYLTIAVGLRDLSTNYIRVFATNKQDMVDQYVRLQDLASEWEYKEDLNPSLYERLEADARQDPGNDRLQADVRESKQRRKHASAELSELTKRTASTLADLAERANKGGVAAT